jgi:hypothetical protein
MGKTIFIWLCVLLGIGGVFGYVFGRFTAEPLSGWLCLGVAVSPYIWAAFMLVGRWLLGLDDLLQKASSIETSLRPKN